MPVSSNEPKIFREGGCSPMADNLYVIDLSASEETASNPKYVDRLLVQLVLWRSQKESLAWGRSRSFSMWTSGEPVWSRKHALRLQAGKAIWRCFAVRSWPPVYRVMRVQCLAIVNKTNRGTFEMPPRPRERQDLSGPRWLSGSLSEFCR